MSEQEFIEDYQCYNFDCRYSRKFKISVPDMIIHRPEEEKVDILTTVCSHCNQYRRFYLFSPSEERKVKAV